MLFFECHPEALQDLAPTTNDASRNIRGERLHAEGKSRLMYGGDVRRRAMDTPTNLGFHFAKRGGVLKLPRGPGRYARLVVWNGAVDREDFQISHASYAWTLDASKFPPARFSTQRMPAPINTCLLIYAWHETRPFRPSRGNTPEQCTLPPVIVCVQQPGRIYLRA